MHDELEPGRLLGERFRLVRKLGHGAVGVVWLAADTHLHEEPVALKLLNRSFADDRRAIADLKREVLLTRKLRHPNIVAIHSFWDLENLRFITMEYVEGRTLEQLLAARGGAFQLEEILGWIDQLCQALDHAHQRGVLHRDVKPGNIMVGTLGEVRLTDFGIARTAREVSARMKGHVTSGTLLYMSPEQLMGDPLDQRSDLYSLAATIYELLSGEPPFYKGAIANQIQSKTPAPIAQYEGPISTLVLRALSKDPNHRHESCGAFFSELAAVGGYVAGAPTPLSFVESQPDDVIPVYDPNAETVEMRVARPGTESKPLGTLLVDAGLLSNAQLVEALLEHEGTRERLGVLLVRLGLVSEDAITEALRRQFRMPRIQLDSTTIDVDVARSIPRDHAERLVCLPVRKHGNRILVAMADPLNFGALNELEEFFQSPIEPCIASHAEIQTALAKLHGNPKKPRAKSKPRKKSV